MNQQDLIAWQFHRPDLGEGLVQAFRRPKCPQSTALFPLRGLDSTARYRVTDLNLLKTNVFTGSELLGKGLPISLPNTPCAATVIYVKQPPPR